MGKEAFAMKPKHRCCLSQRGQWVYDSQIWKERRLLHESVFIRINKRTLILKNGRKKSFSYETKTSIHLSQWAEWVYGSQSWKEKRLLCKSVFIKIDKRTLFLKNGRKGRLSYETKASMSFILMGGMSLWFLMMKRKEIIMRIHVCQVDKWTLILKKWWVEKLLVQNQSINVVYPNKENNFMIPNHENKGDY